MTTPPRPSSTPSRLARLRCLGPVALAGLALACASRPTLEMPELAGLRASLPIAEAQAERGEGPPEWINHPREDDEWVYGLGIARETRSAQESLYRALGGARTAVLDHLHEEGARAPSPAGLGPALGLDPDAVEFEAVYLDERTRTWYALARLDREAVAEEIRASLEALDAQAVEDVRRLERGIESVSLALRLLFTLDRREQLAAQLAALGAEVPERPTDRGDITGTMRAREVLSRHPFQIQVDAPPVPEARDAVRAALGELAIGTAEFGGAGEPWVAVRLAERGDWSRRVRYLRVEGAVELSLGDGTVRNVPIRAVATGHTPDEARDRAARIARDEVASAVRRTLLESGRGPAVSSGR